MRRLPVICIGLLLAGLANLASSDRGQAADAACKATDEIIYDENRAPGTTQVALCRGFVQLLQLPGPIDVVIVGDSGMVSVNVLTPERLAVTAQKAGRTNLVIMYNERSKLAEFDLTVGASAGARETQDTSEENADNSSGSDENSNSSERRAQNNEQASSGSDGNGEGDSTQDYRPPHRIIIYRGTKIEVIECQPACTGL